MEKSFSERVDEAKGAIESISAQAARELEGTVGVVFVDPRPAQAIASTTGIIPGASNVHLDDISGGALPQELSDKSSRVITACQGGPMGAIAAHELANQGFASVNYIEGGTQAWIDAGFPTHR